MRRPGGPGLKGSLKGLLKGSDVSLKKEQYDSIMNEYAAIRDRHRSELEKRRMQAYARIPELQELEERTPSLAVGLLRKRLRQEGEADTASFRETAARIARKRAQLLADRGFPPDYLEMTWDCPDCRDTGYTAEGKCHCFRKRETAILYDQSNLQALTENAGFSLLSESYYTGEELRLFRHARRTCELFVKNFDKGPRNIYLYGTVGTGKTMLSVCVAKALLELGKSVLYFSASSLFDRLADCTFGSGSRSDLREFTSDLYSCDLLIIDDLGTEYTNAFVASQLFTCISERELNRKPTIISTNLSLKELQARYSDRVFSRITSSCDICKLTGRDIRLQKRRAGR